jgi:hypothetical protein
MLLKVVFDKTAFLNLGLVKTLNKTLMKHTQKNKNKNPLENPYQPMDFYKIKKKISKLKVSETFAKCL